MFVTSLMPDSRAAILDERGSAGVARSGEALVGGGVWCVALRESASSQVARGVGVAVCGRRGTVDIVACVAPRGTAEVWRGARSGRSGACARSNSTRPQTAWLGPRSGQRAARGCRATPDHATTPQMPQQRRGTAGSAPHRFAVARLSGAPVSSASAGGERYVQ